MNEELNPKNTQLPPGEMQPEDVLEIYRKQVRRPEAMLKRGPIGFAHRVGHLLLGGRAANLSIKKEAQMEIDSRRGAAQVYAEKNRLALEAQAKAEMEDDFSKRKAA